MDSIKYNEEIDRIKKEVELEKLQLPSDSSLNPKLSWEDIVGELVEMNVSLPAKDIIEIFDIAENDMPDLIMISDWWTSLQTIIEDYINDKEK